MTIESSSTTSGLKLPEDLKSLFWDCDFSSIDLQEHHNFIIRRILDRGNWQEITWLRHYLGDEAIKQWFLAKNGGGLDARKLRFWEVILDIPKPDVDRWVERALASIWNGKRM